MSDNWICVIPKDPNWTPNSNQISAVQAVLKSIMAQSEGIKFEIDDAVKFRDCGGNFESVECPKCKMEMSTEKWQELMDLDYSESGFKMNKYKMECCGIEITLNHLVYHYNQGFSRFVISCVNPNKGELSGKEIVRIEDALATKISVVFRHI